LDVVGEAFNTDSKPVEAVAYGNAVRNQYTIPDSANYVKPEMVVMLPEVHFAPKPGPLEPVDEVSYYNIDSLTNRLLQRRLTS
jgi:hypothetical protein